MSDEEFDLKKKKKKSKKVDFDAFETEDTNQVGGDDDGVVAAAVAEKIEDLDRKCFVFFSRFGFFFVFFFSSSASSFLNAAAVFIRREKMVTMRTR